jgi:hypothetical protein
MASFPCSPSGCVVAIQLPRQNNSKNHFFCFSLPYFLTKKQRRVGEPVVEREQWGSCCSLFPLSQPFLPTPQSLPGLASLPGFSSKTTFNPSYPTRPHFVEKVRRRAFIPNCTELLAKYLCHHYNQDGFSPKSDLQRESFHPNP